MTRLLTCVVAIAITVGLAVPVDAQRAGGPAAPPRAPRAAAPIDLTGTWVSIVTQDWRLRMLTPGKGDYQGVQMTPEARKIADAWDPAKDEAAGEQCKSYGAPALMSVPGRVRISWQDDNTLKVETDAGTQTRLIVFGTSQGSAPQGGASQSGAPQGGAPQSGANTPRSWQGTSVAQWQTPRPNVPLLLRPAERSADAPVVRPTGGSLRVVTTNLRSGYLRKNGVPYSENATLTEHWDLSKLPNGQEWLTITTELNDPQYLRGPRLTAPAFRKEPNNTKWDPSPCSAR